MDDYIPEIIIRVLKNTQTEEEMLVFSQWYNTSQENKELFFQLKDIYECRKDGLKPDDQEVKESWDRLWRKLNTRSSAVRAFQEKDKSKQRLRNVKYSSVAAAAMLLIISGIHFFLKDHEAISWIEVQTVGQSVPRSIHLPDGSTVQLNASSFLKYPEKFNSKKREVYLDGEAYFTVAKSDRHPFIVHADKQQINVLGTEFNVLGYSSDPYIITTLVTGKVKLETFDSETNLKSEIVMHPCQQVYFDKILNKTTVSNIDALEATSWMKGIYSFKDTPLKEIARRLEKVYDITIIISDETHKNEKYTGKFFAHQDILEVIKIINFSGQFDYTFNNDTIILQKKH